MYVIFLCPNISVSLSTSENKVLESVNMHNKP